MTACLDETHPRQGFRRAYHGARSECWTVNHKKIQRLWRDEGLRGPLRRRNAWKPPPRRRQRAPNRVWAVDFRFDASDDARPVQIVSIVDETHPRMLGPAGGT